MEEEIFTRTSEVGLHKEGRKLISRKESTTELRIVGVLSTSGIPVPVIVFREVRSVELGSSSYTAP